jgi:hypothetical protein
VDVSQEATITSVLLDIETPLEIEEPNENNDGNRNPHKQQSKWYEKQCFTSRQFLPPRLPFHKFLEPMLTKQLEA